MRPIDGDRLKTAADEKINMVVSISEFLDLIDEQPTMDSDCKICGKAGTCKHNTGNPGLLRFNCPLWRAKV